MKFKYSQHPLPGGDSIYRPTIPILLKLKSKFIFVEAVVDSGADFTILPIEIAGILDIVLQKKDKKIFLGAGNNSFSVYRSPEPISHLIRQDGHRPLKWESKVYFAESQPAILLGNIGFLENFRVVLDGKNKYLEIKSES